MPENKTKAKKKLSNRLYDQVAHLVYSSERPGYGEKSQKKPEVAAPFQENKHRTILTNKGSRQVSLTNTGLPDKKKLKYIRSKPTSKIVNDMKYMKYKDNYTSQPTYKD